MNKLEIENLSKIYGKKVANDKITVTLENGVYGLLGPNGAGKSTLMKQITTLIKPDEGQILYNGEDIFKMDADYRNILGYLPQEFGVYKNFTAKEFLQYIGALKGLRGKYLNSKIGELLDLVGLYDVRNKSIGKFSGGMKRRVGIAQVLLNDPKIIVLDEPTAGLDPQERARFRNLIAKMSRDKIIILSTHIISDIESVAKETIMN
ncbi:ABC transporter ATP-binding protein [Clostridioides difficile]|uniref:ABC transporter ATP-binding protein n=1 Tax=Clostridioides difficile TaxID=1496 RepID=UPI002E8E4884|nr:ABC transporter ATP-binding protein [Clostridioides difficile]